MSKVELFYEEVSELKDLLLCCSEEYEIGSKKEKYLTAAVIHIEHCKERLQRFIGLEQQEEDLRRCKEKLVDGASPDMLKALEKIKTLSRGSGFYLEEDMAAIERLVDAAIAKATGETE